MFIDPIFIGCEGCCGAEGEGFAGEEICDGVSLMRHRQFDLLIRVGGVADHDHTLLLIGILDIRHLGVERTGDLFASAEVRRLAIGFEQVLHRRAGRIVRREIHNVIIEEIDSGHVTQFLGGVDHRHSGQESGEAESGEFSLRRTIERPWSRRS